MVTQEAKDLGGRIADLEGRGRAIGSNKLGRGQRKTGRLKSLTPSAPPLRFTLYQPRFLYGDSAGAR